MTVENEYLSDSNSLAYNVPIISQFSLFWSSYLQVKCVLAYLLVQLDRSGGRRDLKVKVPVRILDCILSPANCSEGCRREGKVNVLSVAHFWWEKMLLGAENSWTQWKGFLENHKNTKSINQETLSFLFNTIFYTFNK